MPASEKGPHDSEVETQAQDADLGPGYLLSASAAGLASSIHPFDHYAEFHPVVRYFREDDWGEPEGNLRNIHSVFTYLSLKTMDGLSGGLHGSETSLAHLMSRNIICHYIYIMKYYDIYMPLYAAALVLAKGLGHVSGAKIEDRARKAAEFIYEIQDRLQKATGPTVYLERWLSG